ncbi:MAG: hypothetical protein R2867_40580 [Caldilineaceae bacterium]
MMIVVKWSAVVVLNYGQPTNVSGYQNDCTFHRAARSTRWAYDTPAARIVIDAAGLDATVILLRTGTGGRRRSRPPRSKQHRSICWLPCRDDYSTNHDFQSSSCYVAFTMADGLYPLPYQIHIPQALHASGDLIAAAVGDNAQHVVIGKDIHIGGGAPQAIHTRKRIGLSQRWYGADWAAAYTPLAGIAGSNVRGPRSMAHV